MNADRHVSTLEKRSFERGCGGGNKVKEEKGRRGFSPGVLVLYVQYKIPRSEVIIRYMHAFLRWLTMDVSDDNFF